MKMHVHMCGPADIHSTSVGDLGTPLEREEGETRALRKGCFARKHEQARVRDLLAPDENQPTAVTVPTKPAASGW